MSAGFVKIYGSILRSSVWLEDSDTRIVWLTLLALADLTGFVETSLPGLAHSANVAFEDCRRAVAKLSKPDPHSKNPSHEGRRIEQVDRGWRVLNYQQYRDLRTKAQVDNADRQRRYRDNRPSVTSNASNAACVTGNGSNGESREVSAVSLSVVSEYGIGGLGGRGEQREAYASAVWKAWEVKRGTSGNEPGPDCSSAEWTLACGWFEAEIPLRVVLRGIVDCAGTITRDTKLLYARQAVEEAIRYYQKATA